MPLKNAPGVLPNRKHLSTSPILVPFVSGERYRLTTDASFIAIGAVLERMNDNKVIGVIGYFSKSVRNTQANYPISPIG